MISAHNRQAIGQNGVDEREIKHVNDFPRHKAAVTFTERNCRRYMKIAAFAEQQTVKCIVDNIAHCPGYDKGNAYDESPRRIALGRLVCETAKESHENNPCRSQGYGSCYIDAKGHSAVFNKIDVHPRSYLAGFVEQEICLDLKFYNLVNKDNGNNNTYCRYNVYSCLGKQHLESASVFLFVEHLFGFD